MQRIEQPTTEQMMRRKANLERKRKQRAREKARTSQAVHDYLEKIARDRVNGEGLARQAKVNLCTLGEIAPGVDTTTIDEALTISREFARAMGVADVMQGESLFDFERRIFTEWVNYDRFRGRPTRPSRVQHARRRDTIFNKL
jgi:hypothetical protein